MRRNTFFSCVKKLSSMFAGCAVLLLASCGSLVDSENSGSGSIRISVNEKVDARTAVTDVTLSEFVKFTLTCDGVQKGSWQTTSEGLSAYAQMTTARIQLADGSHDFVLTAEDASGVTFKDSITKEISGDTILNFSLKLDAIPSEGTGSVKVTVDYSAVKDKIYGISYMLYESGDETNFENSNMLDNWGWYDLTKSGFDSGKFTYTASDIPAGQHILAFYFCDYNYELNTGVWPELVTVLPGRESKSEHAITSLSKVYNIKYYLDGADWGNNVYIGTSEVSLSTPSYNSDGYTFSGWYTAADYTGDTVEGWEPYTRTGDITLYGKVEPKTFNITYYNEDGTAFSGTHKEDAPLTHTYGTNTELKGTEDKEGGLVFAGWYEGTRNDDNTVTLNSSRITTLGGSTYTADIELFAKYVNGVFHVSTAGSNAAYVDDATAYGNGSAEHPFATVTKAVDTIIAQNVQADYRVVAHGELFECVTLDTRLTSSNANSLTIEGATGNSVDKLNGSESGTVLNITTGVPVTLKNIAVTNGNTNQSYSGGGISLGGTSYVANLTLAEGALVTGNRSVGYNTSSSTSVWDNYGYQYGGGGIFVARGKLTIEDGAEISSNTAYVGGGIFVCGYGGTTSVVMNGGVIKENTATGSNTGNYANYYYLGGGGVYVYGRSGTTSFIMNDGEIKNNTVSNADRTGTGGGGIYAYSSYSSVTINGGTISGNSGFKGGGIHKRSANVTLAGGTISSNVSTNECGGAVYGYNAVRIKDSAYIPAGDDLKNDVYSSLIVAGDVTAQTPVATINPAYHREDNVVLYGDGVEMTQELADKFAVKSDGTLWNVGLDTDHNTAVLKRPVYSITYKEKNGADLSVELPEDAPSSHKYYTTTTLPVLTKEGYIFQGWYMDAACEGENFTEISGEAITADATFYTYWTRETLLFTIDKSGIELTKNEGEDGTVTITSADGFKDYSWKIDYGTPSDAITGASVSADGKTLTFNKSNMIKGISYVILVTAIDSENKKQSATVSVKKQEAE